MRLHAYLLVLFFHVSFASLSQDTRVDSLQNKLQVETLVKEKSRLLSSIGMEYYRTQIYYDSAFFYTERAYDLALNYDLDTLQARTLFNLGVIHSSIDEYETAITYYKRAQTVIEALQMVNALDGVLNNIGGNYFELGNYDTAITYYTAALKLAVKQQNTMSVAINYMNIGEAQFKKGNLTASKENLERSLQTIDTIDFNPPTAPLFYARTLLALENVKKAETHAYRAFTIAEEQGDIRYASEASLLLASIYARENQFDKAYQFQEKHFRYSDSLNTAKELNEIEKLQLNFELKEHKEQLTLAIQKNKYQNIIYVLGAAGVLLLVVLVFRQRKIVRMTKDIHGIQKRLVEQELNARMWKKENPNASGFDAAKQQDI